MTRQHSQGFVLVTSLIFLIVLSLLGVMAMRGSLFEERMAANDREHAMAREFAELALRDAERDILGLHFDGTTYCASAGAGVCALRRPAGTRPPNAAEALTFWAANNAVLDDIGAFNGGLGGAANIQGMYSSDAAANCGMPVWSGAAWEAVSPPCAGTIGAVVPTVQYGTFTDAPFNAPAGTARPRYIIEIFRASEDLNIIPVSNKIFFRITAVGFGRTTGVGGARTSVTLQSVFSPS